jgi:tetratricopeptide (TPR) repeat protein
MEESYERRWAELAGRLPPLASAYAEAIADLAGRAEFAAADLGLDAAARLFPGDPAIARQVAHAAERRNAWQAAVAAWQMIRQQSPGDHDATSRLAAAYVRIDQPGEAEALLAAALQGCDESDAANPAMRALSIAHAHTAAARGDFVTAKARWQALARLRPDDPVIAAHLRELAALKLPEIRETAPWMKPAGETTETPHADLMMRFEGLGGTCEFGLMQRYYGAEPLGLFRWAGINLVNLCTALGNDLAGIGEPEFTRLEVTPVGEFVTSDSRYGLGMHTFMRDTGQDRDKLLQQLQRRMRFLREKLLNDLRDGEKIFVYRHMLSPHDRQLHRLLAALRAHNPANRLVVIRMLPHGARGEVLRPFAPGAACGAIANGRRPVQGTGWAIDNEFWLKTCQEAVEMLN